jgi:hypothetical protein
MLSNTMIVFKYIKTIIKLSWTGHGDQLQAQHM